MDIDAPPLTVAEEVLEKLAPELARHVHAFLHGGGLPGSFSTEHDYSYASIRLRHLHDALSDALLRRKDEYRVTVLATAVRLQALVLYETIGRTYKQGRNHG